MPEGLLTRPARPARSAALVAGLALASLPLSGSPVAAAPVAAEPAACAADEVTVVVDFNELGGETRVACAPGPGAAAELFVAAGFPLATANAPGMDGFACRVSGRPAQGPCGQGDAYWSLWWSQRPEASAPATWAYASLGVSQLELEPGSYLGFSWHQGKGAATPPDVTITGADGVRAQGSDEVAEGPAEVTESDDEQGSRASTWLLVGGAVVVLGAAAVVPLRRRRRGGQQP